MSKVSGTKYEVEYIPSKNLFSVRVWGSYTAEDATAFIRDYTAETKKFIPQNTSLVIDGTEITTSTSEAKKLLAECIKLYMQLPYKNRFFVKSTSATANLMLRNAMKTGGMVIDQDAVFIDSLMAAADNAGIVN